MRPRRRRWILRIGAVVVAGLACNLGGTPSALPTPSTSGPAGAATPMAPTPVTPPEQPLIVTHLDPEFRIYTLDGDLVETRSAEGLSFSRPNTAHVVGDAVYYVAGGGVESGEVVRRVTSTESVDLAFTRSSEPTGLAFRVSQDGSHIAYSQTNWAAGPPFSQLWIAGIDGSSPTLVTQTDTQDDIPEYFVLEPVEWLDDGDLVFAWQVTGIGGYILFFGWSGLYRYDIGGGAVTPVAAVDAEFPSPCWSDVNGDGTFAVGACGGPAQILERSTATGSESLIPLLPEQGQAGAAAYAPSGDRFAYAIARSNPDDEAGQLVLLPGRGEGPAVIASHAPGAFDAILWLDEDRMAVGYWQGDASFVDLVTTVGARTPLGQGSLIGLMQP